MWSGLQRVLGGGLCRLCGGLFCGSGGLGGGGGLSGGLFCCGGGLGHGLFCGGGGLSGGLFSSGEEQMSWILPVVSTVVHTAMH
ncbi:hypothetical protein AAHA92_27576 [Salvia divinorum]|uniref:Uncharacterized protein n=1 Tax=Salvia divinorum TaxID=28513 RepID=A0ABD1G451_SALDI